MAGYVIGGLIAGIISACTVLVLAALFFRPLVNSLRAEMHAIRQTHAEETARAVRELSQLSNTCSSLAKEILRRDDLTGDVPVPRSRRGSGARG